jgi:hypothetical protein
MGTYHHITICHQQQYFIIIINIYFNNTTVLLWNHLEYVNKTTHQPLPTYLLEYMDKTTDQVISIEPIWDLAYYRIQWEIKHLQ